MSGRVRGIAYQLSCLHRGLDWNGDGEVPVVGAKALCGACDGERTVVWTDRDGYAVPAAAEALRAGESRADLPCEPDHAESAGIGPPCPLLSEAGAS